MRQYLVGVLIVLLVQHCSEAFCDLHDRNEIDKSAFVLEVSDGINGRPVSSDSVSSVEDEYDSLESVEREFSGEDMLGPQVPDIDETLAYWQSIYGTEDVPEFEVPPTIDGDSIFMDLSELTDDLDDEGGIVKRHVDDALAPVEEMRNHENFGGDFGTFSGYQNRENGFHGAATKTVSISKKEQRKSSRTTKSSRKSESRSSSRITASHNIDSRIKSKGRTQSVVDSKLRLLQEKKDLIDAVVAGATEAKISDALQHTIEAKKDLIDSVMTAKADLIQRKKDAIHSHAGQCCSTGSGVSRLIESEGSFGHILDSAQEALNAKQDLIDVAITGGNEAELADALQHTIAAKKELIDSVISTKADLMHRKKDFSHSHGGFDHGHSVSISSGASGSIQSQDSFTHVLDSAQEALHAKQDLIDVVAAGGSTAELADAVQHTIEAKKDLIDTVISSNADLVQRKKSSSHAGFGHKKHLFIDTGISGSIQSHGPLGHILDSAQDALHAKQDLIDVAITGGNEAELADALQHTIAAKKELIDSVISTKADLMHRKKDFSHSHGGFDHGHSVSISSGASGSIQSQDSLTHILDSAQEALHAKQDLIDVVATGGSTAELADAVQHTIEAKKDLIDTVISSNADLVQRKKSSSHAGFDHKKHLSIETGISGSIQSQDSLGHILDSAQEALEAKQDLINIAISGGSKAELADAVQHTIQAKEDLIDSVISSKADSIQRKKGSTRSHGGRDHRLGCFTNTASSDSLRPILTSAQEVLQKKKDLIDVVAARGTKAEFCDAVGHAIEAKKDLIDTVISTKADLIQRKKDIIHSHVGLDHGSSGSIRPQESRGQILDLKRKVLKEKKNLIDIALAGGSKAELTDAVVKTLDAKGDLVDSMISNRAERIQNRKDHNRHSAGSCCSGSKRHREVSRKTNSQINSEISTNFQPGSISSHSQLEGTKSFSGGTATHTVIGGGIEVETSLNEDVNHHHVGSLIVNNEIRSDAHIHLHPDLTTKQIEIDSISSSSEISSSNSDSIETDVPFGTPTILDSASSSESSSSESSEILTPGEIEIATSASSDQFPEDSLNLNSDVQSNGHLSIDLQSGITSQIGIDAAGIYEHSFEAGKGTSQTTNIAMEGDLGVDISTDDSSSEDISSSESAEINSSIGVSGSLDSDLPESEITIDSGIDSSMISKIAINKNLELGDSGIDIGGSIDLNVSGHSEIELPKLDIFGTVAQDDSLLIHKECGSGECGITGKLRVGSNVKSESSFQHREEMKIPFEKCFAQDHTTHVMVEEIPEAENEQSVTVVVDDIGQAEESEESDNYSRDLERHSVKKGDLDFEANVEVEANKEELGSATISTSTNLEFDVDSDDDEGTAIIDLGELVDQEDSIATKTSGVAVNLSGGSQAGITTSKDLGEISGATDLKSGFQVSVDLDNIENNQNHQQPTSTYDEKYGNDYSIPVYHHQLPETGKFSHFQHFDASHSHLAENADFYDADKIFSNAHGRLINLDDNCTGINAALSPECQGLNTHLWQSRDTGAPITLRTVKTYLSHGQELAIEMQIRAKWLCDKGFIPKRHTPAMLHLINNLATENTVEINLESENSLFGTKLLQRRFSSEFHVTANTFVEFLKYHSFRVLEEGTQSIRPKRCPANDIYRSFDGSCNNQHHPSWGQSNTAFARLLPARYHDGVHEIAKSVTGRELPNPRAVSVHCFSRKEISDRKLTLALAQWGQLLSHDFALQIIDQTVQGGIQCCADGKYPLPKNLQHHSCLPIEISENDRFYSKFGSRCMNFVRSMTICKEDGTLGPANQLNTVTSYLDASPLYGSNKETCDKLRDFKSGRMKIAFRRGRELLPTITNASRFCDVMSPNEVCYLAGDIRVNQNPQIAILQTVLLREHNSIADRLTVLNPHWDDERVFQETRRIVIAEYQCITYNEWLPLVIGEKYCRTHRLTPRVKSKMSRDYDPRIKAATINSFTTGAFRLFHTMVDGHINLCPANREISHTLRLSNHYFRPQIIEQHNNMDDLIRGLVTQAMNAADKNFHPEITEYLFRSRNEFGLDLESLDIQRSRDHGLCGYNNYREICGLKKAEDFEDLIEEISYDNIARLKGIYDHVDDIDLIVGAVLEKKCPGSTLGPVARCLLGEQFYRSRIGDRYFYNNAGQPHSFTQEQFEEINKASFARLLCNTGDNIEAIQAEAFRIISPNNPLEYCCALPQIDLSPWKELRYD